ncbi:MAG: RNA pseudouridine synthase [Verrucomicrobiales bacterium]|nr:RNA pseudouridine synthase [Verrucomicrobiales bacterium]
MPRFSLNPVYWQLFYTAIDLRLQNPHFDVIAETNAFIVVNKPPHLLVHPSKPGNPPTLLDGLENLLSFDLATGGQLSIITRLDRETSGCVLVAKTKESAREFGLAMQNGEFRKTYHAICWNWPDTDEFVIDVPILRKGEVDESPIWVKQIVHPDGKLCRTECRVVRRFEKNDTPFSLIECRPKTGRMHQIRVHLSHAGFPIVGDKIYGPSESCYLDFIETGWTPELEEQLLLNRQALHAAKLGWKSLEWEAPLTADLEAFLA